jgi:aspartokinase/homoserine dehydrogenase 1
MVVMKFGGTSLGSGPRILKAASLVAGKRQLQPLIVVSAMSQVTNTLVELIDNIRSRSHVSAGIARLREQHQAAAKALGLEPAAETALLTTLDKLITDFEAILKNIALLDEMTPASRDLIICFGERLSIHLMAAALQKHALPAVALEASELIVTDENFGNAAPILAATRRLVKPKLRQYIEKGVTPVITGFMGATPEGIVTTLGRGGSDYSATIIGHCVDADEVWIWTDVDGVMTADPRLIPQAHTISELSYEEAAELSYFGAKVLHPRTMLPAALSNMPIWIKNTLNPAGRGTKITNNSQPHPNGAKATTVLDHLSLITIQGKGMQGVYGLAAKAFTALAEQRVNVLFISQASSENNISLGIYGHDAPRAVEALQAIFQSELKIKNLEAIQAESDLAIIAVVGEGMRHHTGIAGRVFSALGSANVNVIAIAQGSSERNISFVVRESAAAAALQSIHNELHLENGKQKQHDSL